MLNKVKVFAGLLGMIGFVSAWAAPNLVVNGDFSQGNTGFSTDYALTTMTPYLFENGVHGIYAVIPAGSIASSSAYGDWTNISADPSGGNGNVFVAHGATSSNTTVWSQTVAVAANTTYVFSFYGAEVSNACCSNATLRPTVGGVQGAALGVNGTWQKSADFVWKSGSSTSVLLGVVDSNTDGAFNDFAVTDFSLTAAVPEPGVAMMMLGGLAAVGWGVRRGRRPAI